MVKIQQGLIFAYFKDFEFDSTFHFDFSHLKHYVIGGLTISSSGKNKSRPLSGKRLPFRTAESAVKATMLSSSLRD